MIVGRETVICLTTRWSRPLGFASRRLNSTVMQLRSGSCL
jgi:hypothetical protein